MQKKFQEDLDFKIWATKGTKFIAHERLSLLQKLSSQSLSYLTAYLVIINLIPLFNTTKHLLSADLISFSTTVLSILVLVFGQIESSAGYSIKALKQHECGRQLSKLHLELVNLSTQNLSEEEIDDKYRSYASKYSDILDAYENHESIDYQLFKISNSSKYGVSESDKWKVRIKYYFSNFFLYHFLILSPILIGLIYIIF
jgi:hypothetical protein